MQNGNPYDHTDSQSVFLLILNTFYLINNLFNNIVYLKMNV